MTTTRRLAVIVVAAIGIIAAACGDDDASITTTIAADATTITNVPDTAAVSTTVVDAGTTTTKAPAETTTTAATTTTTGASITFPTLTLPFVTLTIPPTTTTPAATLDPSLAPFHGNKTAAAGFQPDPITYVAFAGGLVDVSYLGGGCVGFAPPGPGFDFEWTGSIGMRLRFFFIPDDGVSDPVLVIHGPDGNWSCNDDYAQSRSPLIDFPTGPNGHYDIWVGTYQSGDGFAGTLYITEFLYNPYDALPPGA